MRWMEYVTVLILSILSKKKNGPKESKGLQNIFSKSAVRESHRNMDRTPRHQMHRLAISPSAELARIPLDGRKRACRLRSVSPCAHKPWKLEHRCQVKIPRTAPTAPTSNVRANYKRPRMPGKKRYCNSLIHSCSSYRPQNQSPSCLHQK